MDKDDKKKEQKPRLARVSMPCSSLPLFISFNRKINF